MQSVLGSLDTLYIPGEWASGDDTSGLDNVIMTTAPEPSHSRPFSALVPSACLLTHGDGEVHRTSSEQVSDPIEPSVFLQGGFFRWQIENLSTRPRFFRRHFFRATPLTTVKPVQEITTVPLFPKMQQDGYREQAPHGYRQGGPGGRGRDWGISAGIVVKRRKPNSVVLVRPWLLGGRVRRSAILERTSPPSFRSFRAEKSSRIWASSEHEADPRTPSDRPTHDDERSH